MILSRIFTLLLTILLMACSEKPPEPVVEYFHLKDLDKMETYEHPPGNLKTGTDEYFIVTGLPNDRKKLRKIIDEYNEETLSPEELKKHHNYARYFFRESERLPRTYKESYPEKGAEDSIEDHYEDLLIVVMWINYGAGKNYSFYKDGNVVYSEFEGDPG